MLGPNGFVQLRALREEEQLLLATTGSSEKHLQYDVT